MFSEKELKLEENELREQLRSLPAAQQDHYLKLESRWLKNPHTYLQLNWYFPLGIHHFYLRRWVRGTLNLLLTLTGIYLIVFSAAPLYGVLLITAVAIIEIPQLLNARHLVHSRNIQIMHTCLIEAKKVFNG